VSNYMARDIVLTQKAETALCEICGGAGCVLAMNVVHEFGKPDEATEVLIPCPGCFSMAAVLTMGMRNL
jgi:hypothetical protein